MVAGPIVVAATLLAVPLRTYMAWRDEQQALAELGRGIVAIPSTPFAHTSPSWPLQYLGSWYVRMYDRVVLLQAERTLVDKDIVHVCRLQGLVCLIAPGSEFSGDALGHLPALHDLNTLDLSSCSEITEEGMASLARMPRLTRLNLAAAPVTDASLAHLAKSRTLAELDLSSTHVSDAGLNFMLRVSTLRQLNLAATRVTDAGISDFRRNRPDVDVSR
jgi:hypothetical protein